MKLKNPSYALLQTYICQSYCRRSREGELEHVIDKDNSLIFHSNRKQITGPVCSLSLSEEGEGTYSLDLLAILFCLKTSLRAEPLALSSPLETYALF